MRLATPSCHHLLPLAVCLVAAGCRFLGHAPEPNDAFAAGADAHSKPPARTLHVEVLLVRCDQHDQQLRNELWTFVDETAVGEPLARRLNANGIRAGVVTGHLPEHLQARLTPATAATEVDPADATVSRWLLQVLPGRRSEIVTSTAAEELVMFTQFDDTVRGATYRAATALLAMEVEPAADGRTRIEAVPEVKHGPQQTPWVAEDGSYRLETGQRRERMEPLGIDVTLPRQGMLLIASACADAATVGDGLLRSHGPDGQETTRLIVIRPLAGGVDPTFAPPAVADDTAADSAPLVVR